MFEVEIDPVMQALGYCCGRKYTFNPQVLCCYGKQLCTIPRDAKYYSYQNRCVSIESDKSLLVVNIHTYNTHTCVHIQLLLISFYLVIFYEFCTNKFVSYI